MPIPVIRSAGPEDEPAVIDVMTLAFSADPMTRWTLPGAETYLSVMPKVTRAFGGNGIAHGSTYMLDGGAGAAMWLPPGVEPDAETLVGLIQEHATEAILPEVTAILEQMGSYHPTEPHWYLPLIGIDPAYHGRGYGSALMEHALRHADADGVPAYLESSNPRNIPLYLRHGFEILGTIQVGSSPELVPMLRKPGGKG